MELKFTKLFVVMSPCAPVRGFAVTFQLSELPVTDLAAQISPLIVQLLLIETVPEST